MLATLPLLENSDFPPITRSRLETLQVNLGYRCNQSCLHCHVNAGPRRREQMNRETIGLVLDILAQKKIQRLDLTGGAPELNAHFRYLVSAARELEVHVIDRCNLTILQEPGQQDLADFLAEQGVEIVASLPCYLQENVDTQRGTGVYSGSIEGLKKLNARGYGKHDNGLVLNLVYNPAGATLPPPQAQLQADYKKRLAEQGIVCAVHWSASTGKAICMTAISIRCWNCPCPFPAITVPISVIFCSRILKGGPSLWPIIATAALRVRAAVVEAP